MQWMFKAIPYRIYRSTAVLNATPAGAGPPVFCERTRASSKTFQRTAIEAQRRRADEFADILDEAAQEENRTASQDCAAMVGAMMVTRGLFNRHLCLIFTL
jgi:hypothetical protein